MSDLAGVDLAEQDLVVMGRIVAPYGVMGWVKIKPDTEKIDGLLDYANWFVGQPNAWQAVKAVDAKLHNEVLAVKLSGVNERNGALALKGKLVAVPRAALPRPPENEYYWSDLIGLSVKNLQNVDFGVITDVFETGANDVLEITGEVSGVKRERLLPFIAQVVIDVSMSEKTIQVDWDAEF